MFLLYVCAIIINAQLVFGREEWIDPHDMNTNRRSYDNSCNLQCDCAAAPITFSMLSYKRLINLILSATRAETHGGYTGNVNLLLTDAQFNYLRNFAGDSNNVEDAAVLRKVDDILAKILKKSAQERLIESLMSWSDHIYFTFYNRTTLIMLSCIFVTFISYKLLRANLTIWSVVRYLILLGWLTDFAFTWINLLQEAEINKMADSLMYESMPPNCDPNTMTIWQYIKYSFSSESDCRKYHQTRFKDHFWSIAPVTVMSHQFGVLVYTPASLVGQALGTFTSGILSTLPWGVNIILLPILLIVSVVLTCIIFSFITQTSFGFNFFHLIQLEFGNEQRRAVGDVLSGHNLAALLNIAHRNMVEDVKQGTTASTEISNNCSDEKKESVVVDQIQNNQDKDGFKKSDLNEPKPDKDTCCESEIPALPCISNAEAKSVVIHDGSGDNF